MANEHPEKVERGSVRVLSVHRQQKKGRPFLCVGRILDGREIKCSNVLGSYDCRWRCDREARYLIYAFGSKRGWGACRACLYDLLDHLLERPANEYAKIEADEVADRVSAERRRSHTGCVSYSRTDPDGLCQRPVVVACTTCHVYGGDGRERILQRTCARHAVWHRKRGHVLEGRIVNEGTPKVEEPRSGDFSSSSSKSKELASLADAPRSHGAR